MDDQLAFDFGAPAASDGLDDWRKERRARLAALADALGLPLGHRVRIEFATGSPLEGLLALDEEQLFVPIRRNAHLVLRIGDATFEARNVASCTTLDR
jgi:hypothetical protein